MSLRDSHNHTVPMGLLFSEDKIIEVSWYLYFLLSMVNTWSALEKCGSVDVLHCYYAHGENNENFQRRSYWMLDGRLEHIVLVHYRDINEPSGSSISPHTLTTDRNRINQQQLQTEPVRFEEDSGEDLGRHAAPLDEASAGFNFAPLPRESPLMKERFTGFPSPIHNIYTDGFMSKGLSIKDLTSSLEQQKTRIASKGVFSF